MPTRTGHGGHVAPAPLPTLHQDAAKQILFNSHLDL